MEESAMTELRQKMVEDMKIRHFSPQTQYGYIRSVEKFAQHFGRPPERLGRGARFGSVGREYRLPRSPSR
jgi:hypothetical protein